MFDNLRAKNRNLWLTRRTGGQIWLAVENPTGLWHTGVVGPWHLWSGCQSMMKHMEVDLHTVQGDSTVYFTFSIRPIYLHGLRVMKTLQIDGVPSLSLAIFIVIYLQLIFEHPNAIWGTVAVCNIKCLSLFQFSLWIMDMWPFPQN